MDNPALSSYELHPLIANRWSPLAFADRAVEPEKVGSLLEAARWAPSSYNEQPWVYFVATKQQPAEFEKLLSCLVEGNKPWAINAGVLMLAVAKLNFDRNGKSNRHAQHDVGLASGNLVIQATALGLVVHQMAGFDPDKARDVLNVPASYEPLTMIAIGYQGDADSLPENYQSRESTPRSRKPLSEMVFTGTWGQSWDGASS